MNRLGSRAPGGPIVFAGSLNEAGTVTIDGKPATVDSANNFRGTAMLTGATTTVTLKAKDASGNETTKQYEVDSAGSTTSYTYDANGNLTADGTKTYYWNALNQLVEVKQGTTTLATFEYDGEGRRTEKVAAGLTHQYIYDAEDIVEERITGSSSDTIRYHHGVGFDEPLARTNGSSVTTYYLADHLGSIVQESSAAAAITLEREYDPWGVAMQGASTSGYAYTGREWDAETGLAFYRARYYSPEAGRFLLDDPAGLIDGPNLSAYVRNGPTGAVDPTGNNTWLQLVPAVVTAVTTTATVATAPAWVGPALIVGGVIATTIAVERLTRPYRSDDAPNIKYPGNDASFDWTSRNPNSKPGDKDGNFWNPKDKVSVRPDLDHAPPIGPHWDVHDRVKKKSWRLFPDGSSCPK